MVFVAWAFYWLNLWGNEGYQWLCAGLIEHPWRIAKRATYLFHWLAKHIGLLLHLKPTISAIGYFDSG